MLNLKKTHDLEDLISLASEVDSLFLNLLNIGEKLTPF